MKRRRYLAGLAALGLLGTAGYAATRDQSLPGGGREQTPTPTPDGQRPPTATDTRTSTDTPTATDTSTDTATPTPSTARTKTVGGVALTVSQLAVESTLAFEDETRTAGDGSTFLLVRLAAENVGDEAANHPRDFRVEHDGTKYEVFRESDVDGTRTESPERTLYEGDGAFWPDATETGWVFAEVPADADTVTFVWRYRYDGTRAEAVWRLRLPR